MIPLKNPLKISLCKRLFITIILPGIIFFISAPVIAISLCLQSESDMALISVDAPTRLPGIEGVVGPEDIVALNLSTDSFQMVLDGSDIDILSNIRAFSMVRGRYLLLSFDTTTILPDIGTVSPNDVIRFSPDRLGEETSGTFSMEMDGSEVGLDTPDEHIDALHAMNDGSLVISTTGDATIAGITADSSSLLQFIPQQTEPNRWEIYLNALNQEAGDIHIDESEDAIPAVYMVRSPSLQRTGRASLSDKFDVFFPRETGERSEGSIDRAELFDESDQSLQDALIDGFSIVRAKVNKDLTTKEFYELWQQEINNPKFVLMDVRTPEEFQEKRIKGAILLDYYNPGFAKDLAALDKKKAYLVYCRSGNRSRKTLDQMQQLGFDESYNMLGGIIQWEKESYPTVAPPVASFTASVTAGKAPLTITFDASASNDPSPNGSIRSYDWDFGDKTTGDSNKITHTFTATGKYTVTLSVTDTEEAKSHTSRFIVAADEKAPGSPSGLTSSNGGKIVSLDWADNKEFDVTGYRIYRSEKSGSGYTKIGESDKSMYPDGSVSAGVTYYYVITAVDGIGLESTYSKELSVTPKDSGTTIWFSLNKAHTFDGVGAVGKEDIIALDLSTGKFSMVLDGSAVGVTSNINAFHEMKNGEILISFDANTNVPKIGKVENRDIVKFTPTTLGANTSGTFELFFDGSDVGLDKASENIDAIHYTGDGGIVISTTGDFGCG